MTSKPGAAYHIALVTLTYRMCVQEGDEDEDQGQGAEEVQITEQERQVIRHELETLQNKVCMLRRCYVK